MKKSLFSAFSALVMVLAGTALPAQAAPAAPVYSQYFESGSLATGSGNSSAPLAVPSGRSSVSITSFFAMNQAAWDSIKGGNRAIAVGGTLTVNGASVSIPVSYYWNFNFPSGSVPSNASGLGATATTAIPSTSFSGNPSFYFSASFREASVGAGLAAGNWVFTPTASIAGVSVLTSDYTQSFAYTINSLTETGSTATATNFYKTGHSCVNTSQLTNGETITVTNSNNGTVGGNGAWESVGNLYRVTTTTASSDSALASGTSSYTYNYNSSLDSGRLLMASFRANEQVNGVTAQSVGISIKNGSNQEISTPCFVGSAAAPTVNNSGSQVVLSYPSLAIAGAESYYETRCFARNSDLVSIANAIGQNGQCTLSNLDANTTYQFSYTVTLYLPGTSNLNGPRVNSASVSSAGAQGGSGGGSQVVVVTPAPVVPVFKQPKFSMPSKIDVDATGKVSLSGKDMGVSTVLIGGKEQKIDTNSDEKLIFDTTGLAKGVHDLVMKGAFGTYTIQKAIQVGEPVVTKVAGVSSRQVGMAGGELSISGQGLEGTSQITMNGQVLEILSKTDSKVTFKIPASTVASVNSIMIEGSFVPVLFKNAFSYTK